MPLNISVAWNRCQGVPVLIPYSGPTPTPAGFDLYSVYVVLYLFASKRTALNAIYFRLEDLPNMVQRH
jgi:hypothetical protein